MAKARYDFDFAVAGGGPAGSSAAISLGQRGHSVVLFERETFPRFHIGESLLSTANDAFAALGVTKKIEAACFPKKWGARLLTHDGQIGRYVDFANASQVTRPQTFQVCREEFDRILLERASEVGVEVREACNVITCEFAPDAAILDVASRGDAATGRVRVQALVDATGRGGLIARKFNLRTEEPRLANIAIYSHYMNVPRLGGPRPDDIRLIARNDAGWFWLIPISKELTSVGVVLPKVLYRRLANGSPEETLNRTIADTAIVAELMREARREWPVRVEKDFSYSASAYAGDRWILAGDAGSFLDPVFSTGVSIAMESGIEAASELHRALAKNDFSASSFAAFSRRQRKRFETFRRFVVGFYTPQFRDVFFSPEPPKLIFRSVVTMLAGRWNASLWTRFLNQLFFGMISIQKRLHITRPVFRRDRDAGYPIQTRSKDPTANGA
ncbi:MAG TPA: NAD(P)/FAD-dependent oxidoreductase [Chthoniobacterales bacterium]|jgi:flavin-dependent dehydrogenase|nr:NAD(P)/FAD-dependent oxidoreductase [Chthoniobacterales bacterium]